MTGFQSAMFDHGGWVANLSYLLLVVSMMTRIGLWLRIGVIGSAATGIAYAALYLNDPILVGWEALLLLVNLVQIARLEWAERRIRFDERDEGLRRVMMAGLPRLHARDLIDRGNWLDAPPGEVLVREHQTLSDLIYLHDGAADVLFDGALVGRCGAGELIGDATVLHGSPATGTVRLVMPSNLWRIGADQLRRYLDLRPELRPVLERQINLSLTSKLGAANQRVSDISQASGWSRQS
jgi:CRP/FNR family cyclic AMP-dependent transcriptional regulator